jgi:hypothetical protein
MSISGRKKGNPMGESKNKCFCVKFNKKLRINFKGAQVTSDGGLVAIREMDEKLGLTEIAEEYLKDSRHGKNIQHEMIGLLRQSVYSRLGGYEDTNDAEGLRKDPGMRAVIGERALERAGAGETTIGRFEKEILLGGNNLNNLDEITTKWIEKIDSVRRNKEILLDIDSSESPVYGEQELSSYNGHFGLKCYHPLFVFNHYGECLKVKLRPGHVHSADGWKEFLEPLLRYYTAKGMTVKLRGDAAFAIPGLFELCEELKVDYAIRIKENNKLWEKIEEFAKRPVGRPGYKPVIKYVSFRYGADSWEKQRRIVAKIEHHEGELFPRIGYIVTSLKWNKSRVVKFYNKRGTCEQWIKEGKYALNWTRLSCQGFEENEVRLKLFIMAYNLGNIFRTLALPGVIKDWSLRTIQLKLIKIGGRLIKHARYYYMLLAEVSIKEWIWRGIMNKISRLCPSPSG